MEAAMCWKRGIPCLPVELPLVKGSLVDQVVGMVSAGEWVIHRLVLHNYRAVVRDDGVVEVIDRIFKLQSGRTKRNVCSENTMETGSSAWRETGRGNFHDIISKTVCCASFCICVTVVAWGPICWGLCTCNEKTVTLGYVHRGIECGPNPTCILAGPGMQDHLTSHMNVNDPWSRTRVFDKWSEFTSSLPQLQHVQPDPKAH